MSSDNDCEELWGYVPGFNKRYIISIHGKAYDLFNKKFVKMTINSGYVYVRLSINEESVLFRLHVLMMRVFVPNYKNKKDVDHIDRNPFNNHINNLRWATKSENRYNTDTNHIKEYKVIIGVDPITDEIKEEGTTQYIAVKYGAALGTVKQKCKRCFTGQWKGLLWYYKTIVKTDKEGMKMLKYLRELNDTNIDCNEKIRFGKAPDFSRYEFTQYGDVWDTKKKAWRKCYTDAHGYWKVWLINDEGKRKHRFVHRMISFAFIHNLTPKERTDINHKDCNTSNCYYKNLEWCTRGENNRHAYENNKNGAKIKVCQFTPDLKFIAVFESVGETFEFLDVNHAARKDNGEIKFGAGHYWIYERRCIKNDDKSYCVPDDIDLTGIYTRYERSKMGLNKKENPNFKFVDETFVHKPNLHNLVDKRICQFTRYGEFVRSYENASEAAWITNFDRKCITNCAKRHEGWLSHREYIWRYQKECVPEDDISYRLTDEDISGLKCRVCQFHLDGTFVDVFDTAKDALLSVGITLELQRQGKGNHIYQSLRKNTSTVYGWIFKYDKNCIKNSAISYSLHKEDIAIDSYVCRFSLKGVFIAIYETRRKAAESIKLPITDYSIDHALYQGNGVAHRNIWVFVRGCINNYDDTFSLKELPKIKHYIFKFDLCGNYMDMYKTQKDALKSVDNKKDNTKKVSTKQISDCVNGITSYSIAYDHIWKFEIDCIENPEGSPSPFSLHPKDIPPLIDVVQEGICQFGLKGNFIRAYRTIEEAYEYLKIENDCEILRCLRHSQDEAHGFLWERVCNCIYEDNQFYLKGDEPVYIEFNFH